MSVENDPFLRAIEGFVERPGTPRFLGKIASGAAGLRRGLLNFRQGLEEYTEDLHTRIEVFGMMSEQKASELRNKTAGERAVLDADKIVWNEQRMMRDQEADVLIAAEQIVDAEYARLTADRPLQFPLTD